MSFSSFSPNSEKAVSEIFYIVERIDDIAESKIKRVKSRAGVTIFIKWEGYPLSDNTWEPIENLNLVNALEMLEGLYANPKVNICLLYTSPSPRDLSTSRMPSSA